MPEPKTCRTCKWWGKDFDGVCARIDPWGTANIQDSAYINVSADDDQGWSTRLYTGPDFGCTLHEPEIPDAESTR